MQDELNKDLFLNVMLESKKSRSTGSPYFLYKNGSLSTTVLTYYDEVASGCICTSVSDWVCFIYSSSFHKMGGLILGQPFLREHCFLGVCNVVTRIYTTALKGFSGLRIK